MDPADDTLYIATHTGMWRLRAEMDQPERVTDLRQDTMGFTVAGPRHFLGSGHPDIRAMREHGLPAHLGLIESRDGGTSWKSISLRGVADFHILRAVGSYVYGFDASNERLLRSSDAGATWRQLVMPPGLVDIAVHPQRPRVVLASTLEGLQRSDDGGSSWRSLDSIVGLLAWPAPGRLVAVQANGVVSASGDGGRSWRDVGDVGGEPAALTAASEQDLYVALHDGTITRSRDGGARWTAVSTPD